MKTYKVISTTRDPWQETELIAKFDNRQDAEEFLATLKEVPMLEYSIYEHEPVDDSDYTVF